MTVRTLALIVLAAAVVVASGCSGGGGHSDPFALCGNGQLDPGEECDDGNTLDNDDCLTTCVKARCGDGFVDLATERCDGINLISCGSHQGETCRCSTVGFDGGTLGCNSSCQFDTSACGAAFTPTVTPTSTPLGPSPTPTPTATPPTRCGNGVLEDTETCTSCAADCVVQPCTATTPMQTVTVDLAIPSGQTVTGVTVVVGYRSDAISLPGSGSDASVGQRVKNKPSNTISAAFDLDYALREVLSRSAGLPNGRIFTVDFDTCTGAAPVSAADLGCSVVGCSNLFGSVDGCTCTATAP